MYCRQCGTEIREGAAFCPHCGAPVNPSAANTKETASPKGPASARPSYASTGDMDSAFGGGLFLAISLVFTLYAGVHLFMQFSFASVLFAIPGVMTCVGCWTAFRDSRRKQGSVSGLQLMYRGLCMLSIFYLCIFTLCLLLLILSLVLRILPNFPRYFLTLCGEMMPLACLAGLLPGVTCALLTSLVSQALAAKGVFTSQPMNPFANGTLQTQNTFSIVGASVMGGLSVINLLSVSAVGSSIINSAEEMQNLVYENQILGYHWFLYPETWIRTLFVNQLVPLPTRKNLYIAVTLIALAVLVILLALRLRKIIQNRQS